MAKVRTTPKMARLAAKKLSSPKSSKTTKRLAGCALVNRKK